MALAGPALAATGTTSAAATQTISAASSIKWGPCSDPDLAKAHAQCGDLQVPLDYDQPDSQQISLAVSRVVHTSPAADYQGVMLVNPGGPGGSGLGLSVLGQFVPNHAGDAYDWIGFDPRGVGSSKPSLSCLPHYFGYNRPYYVPETQELERTWLARSDAYAKACGANGRALLPHMKTTDAAKDMDSIRTALGAQQVNYYGFSYGTYLGQVYSTLFPSRVRRMVLDSNVDPRRVWYAANLDQDVAFDRNINIWFGWLAKYDKVYHLGTTEVAVRKLFYAEEQRLRKQPAGGLIGADEWVDTSGSTSTTCRRSRTPTTAPPAPATTTASPSTTPSSAPMSSGPRAGAGGAGTTTASTARHRSRPGPTPGTTRRASTGRPRLAGQGRQADQGGRQPRRRRAADRRDPRRGHTVHRQPRGS